mmetsp:Transcript_25053/g.64694  ORF Transcript_25053/g.64694 Transcript_25053/m.64694 type:complete len:226 (+) Transcript_25053:46-723(+)|eukprot:CAMPEP_0119407266 /NCGR_PEP_ID=MMETSP1335-20130426/1230_1 /TAXON_ID=259385 /ORGANISM="Chrysoculter rhomboideus, Strain RCC1486" /LENGTH=225 /DNA_ID=CAMNT_0007431363 /DNA_START=46 /DNA_END=723 /DNA_ORIENTATION=-
MTETDGNALLRQLAAERQARASPSVASPSPKALGSSPAKSPAKSPSKSFSSGAGRRLHDGAVLVNTLAPMDGAEDPLAHICLSGVDDKPPEAEYAVEVDCRLDDASFVAEVEGSHIFRLQDGEGNLRDRPAHSGGDVERNIRHLSKSAARIAQARAEGKAVWVHCHQGINRGPAGLIAYLLLHTNVPSLEAAFEAVKAMRAKARTQNNTFATELTAIARSVGKQA